MVADAAATIKEVCEELEVELRGAGFFAGKGDEAARAGMVEPAVAAVARRLGLELTASPESGMHRYTVLADGMPGRVTVVTLAEVEAEGKRSANPDFGVTYAMM